MRLLSRALDHASQSVRRVGNQVLRELGEDPLLAGKLLPSRLHILMQRMAGGGPVQDDPARETCPQDEAIHESEEGKNDSEEGEKTLLRNSESPSSESEAGQYRTKYQYSTYK